MIRRLLLPLAGALAVSAAAAVVDVNVPFKNLRLRDGLVLRDVTIKSLNTSAGTATLSINQELVSVRLSQLPEEVRARLNELAPPLSTEDQEAEKQREAADRKKAVENADRRQRMLEDEARAVRTASRNLNLKNAAETAARAEALPGEVARFAEQRARAFFRYQADPHSNIGAVVDSDIFLEHPEPVPGWGGRYRVEGIAYRQYINNQSSGFGRDGQEFEILIQTHERKKPEIIEIRVK